MDGLSYRLYTDASDEACGCTLQQVQKIKIKDLEGTKAYDVLKKAWENKEPPPRLHNKINTKTEHHDYLQEWASEFEETDVWTERMIGYYSRRFKRAETIYSATEREALAAKEGLIRFQPFIEGVKTVLVTDHTALQWAKTYENSNHWLAAWGTVFSAFAPFLEIVHRPGRKHSNVDPLSRLPRAPPSHISPQQSEESTLTPDNSLVEAQENALDSRPATRIEALWSVQEAFRTEFSHDSNVRGEDSINNAGRKQTQDHSRNYDGKRRTHSHMSENETEDQASSLEKSSESLWNVLNQHPPAIHISISKELRDSFISNYSKDRQFSTPYHEASEAEDSRSTGKRFYKDKNGLLFFINADFQPRLCVLKLLQQSILTEAHKAPLETAHMSPDQLWKKLTAKFYWKRMKTDIQEFCSSCDVCQKTKNPNFNNYGFLIPSPIPTRPYESVSMDFIMDLPWSEGYNAIFVTVDRLSKYAQFLPTTTGLDAEDFGTLFTKNVITRFGLPASIIADRDPRWTSDFWKGIAKSLKTRMVLSSSHHPQHDGQTEIINRFLETMLRAYVSEDKSLWAAWLHVLEFAYNSHVSASTGSTLFSLLLGFQPTSPLDQLSRISTKEYRTLTREASTFVNELQAHRESARLAIARAQETQAKYYDKNRKPFPNMEAGSLVLVNPHSLDWMESRGKGAKLIQRWIGPFEILEKVNPKVYRLRMSDKYPGNPVFNIEHPKPYKSSPPEFEARTVLPETRNKATQEEFEIEGVVGHQYKGRRLELLVRWLGYGPQFDLWASLTDLKNAPEVVREYRCAHDI